MPVTLIFICVFVLIGTIVFNWRRRLEKFSNPEKSAAKMNEVIDLKTHDDKGIVNSSNSTQNKVNQKKDKGKSTIDNNYNEGTPTEREFSGLDNPDGGFNPEDAASQAFDDMMKGVGAGAEAVGKGFGAGYKFTSQAAKDGGNAVWGGMKSGANAVGGGFKDAGNAIGGVITCFSGDTPMKLSDGRMVLLKDIDLDDVLVNGAIVIATLRIRSNINDPFYQIYSKELSNYIYVTGSHYIKNDDKFIHVRDFDEAEKLDTVDDVLYCLVTNDHLIPVGEFMFWDWEDNLIDKSIKV